VSAWRDFPAALASRIGSRVAAYSRLGHGASDPAPLPRPIDFLHGEADALPAVMDALGMDRPALFGHSDGGSIALIAAAAYPDRVHALVLEAPHVFVEDVSVSSIAVMKTAFDEGDLRARLARHHGPNVDIAFRGWNDVWLDPAFRGWSIEALLPRIVCPVLVIQGEDDEYGTLAQVERIARRASGPVETLVLAACGHAPHRDQRDRVLSSVAAFLDNLPS
jgi:pimeloyl-ACP methyl ester carboxylesterase